VLCSCYAKEQEQFLWKILKKIGFFSVFFLILGANPCFWVKNGGWYVSLQGLGDIGKKNTSKNVKK